jgi:hypothetical protein
MRAQRDFPNFANFLYKGLEKMGHLARTAAATRKVALVATRSKPGKKDRKGKGKKKFHETATRVAGLAGAFLVMGPSIAENANETLSAYRSLDPRNKVVKGRPHGFIIKAARKCR